MGSWGADPPCPFSCLHLENILRCFVVGSLRRDDIRSGCATQPIGVRDCVSHPFPKLDSFPVSALLPQKVISIRVLVRIAKRIPHPLVPVPKPKKPQTSELGGERLEDLPLGVGIRLRVPGELPDVDAQLAQAGHLPPHDGPHPGPDERVVRVGLRAGPPGGDGGPAEEEVEVQVADLGETVGEETFGKVEEDGHVLDEKGRARVKGGDGFGIDLSTGEEQCKAVGGKDLECRIPISMVD